MTPKVKSGKVHGRQERQERQKRGVPWIAAASRAGEERGTRKVPFVKSAVDCTRINIGRSARHAFTPYRGAARFAALSLLGVFLVKKKARILGAA